MVARRMNHLSNARYVEDTKYVENTIIDESPFRIMTHISNLSRAFDTVTDIANFTRIVGNVA